MRRTTIRRTVSGTDGVSSACNRRVGGDFTRLKRILLGDEQRVLSDIEEVVRHHDCRVGNDEALQHSVANILASSLREAEVKIHRELAGDCAADRRRHPARDPECERRSCRCDVSEARVFIRASAGYLIAIKSVGKAPTKVGRFIDKALYGSMTVLTGSPKDSPKQHREVLADLADGITAFLTRQKQPPILALSVFLGFFLPGGLILYQVLTLAFQEQVGPLFGDLRAWLTSTFDWFFLLAGNVFVLLCLFLIVSPYGKVRIGGRDATPDYSYSGWFAMLFAAGMGIGLMFYGVSEPISHYSSAIGGTTLEGGARTDWAPLGAAAGSQAEAERLGMAATIFHWGLHPWAVYAIFALALALFAYNKGLPLTMRSAFYPIFGDRVWGWTGHVIDIQAVFATLFGLAASLGIGAEQANAGLEFLFGIPVSDTSKVLLILAITGVALVSVVAGLDAGVKRLSEINMVLAALLLLFVILVGPTLAIITGFFSNLIAYAEYLPALSMPFGREDDNFRQGWTSFYWPGGFRGRPSSACSSRVSAAVVPSVISSSVCC